MVRPNSKIARDTHCFESYTPFISSTIHQFRQ